MKNKGNEKVKNIRSLIEWFEEFQPDDLDQIERILLGLRYVDKDIVNNDEKQDIYRNIKLIKGNILIKNLKTISMKYLGIEGNNRYRNK